MPTLPDMEIPLMGIGTHRSPLTHSILIGSLLETALLLLTRLVLCTHKNLPPNHDPLWESFARQSVGILNAAGKGASIGIAYHLMVDAVAQPGAYHGMPFDMPLETHQAVMGPMPSGKPRLQRHTLAKRLSPQPLRSLLRTNATGQSRCLSLLPFGCN